MNETADITFICDLRGLLRSPTYWERLRFRLSPEWCVIDVCRDESQIREIEWGHLYTHERRRFKKGRTRFSRWRRVS